MQSFQVTVAILILSGCEQPTEAVDCASTSEGCSPVEDTGNPEDYPGFDEFYSDHDDYQWQRTQKAAVEADVVLFVGTSFAVGVTDAIVGFRNAYEKDTMAVEQKIEALERFAEQVIAKV